MSENLGASFSIDVTKLKAGLSQANKLIRESESEFKAAAAGMDDWTKSQQGLEKKIKSLNDIAGVQEKKVTALKSEYNRLISEGLDPTSTKAIDLRTQINKETEALNKSKAEIEKQTKALDDLTNESKDADKALGDVTDGTEKASGGFTTMKGVLADLISAGIQKAIQGLKDLASAAVDAYKELDEGSDNVIKATGATGDAAKQLTDSYKNVAKSFKGDFGDMGSTLGEVNTRFGSTGKELEETTKQFLRFSEITGTDATSAVQMVSRAMEGAGIDSKDYSTVLDQLAVAAQASGVSVDKMAEGLTKYGAPMRALGFDTADTIAIFAQFEKAGVNTEQAFAGMQKAVQNWTKDGKDAKTEFQKTVDLIKNTPDDTKAAQIAMDTFGKKAGTEMADAIKSGRLEYGDFLKIVEGSEGTVSKTYDQTQDGFDKLAIVIQGVKTEMADFVGDIMDKYGPQIEKSIEKITKTAKKVVKWALDNLPEIEATIAGIGTAMAVLFVANKIMALVKAYKAFAVATKGASVAQWALNAAMSANPIGLIVAAIAGLVAAFVVLWKKSDKFRNFWIGLWDKIKTTTKAVFDSIKKFFTDLWEKVQPIVEAIKGAVEIAITEIKEMLTAAWEAIKAVWDFVEPYFAEIWEKIKAIFSVVKDVLGTYFSVAWDYIKGVWDVVVKYFKMIWENIKVIYSAVKDTLLSFFKTAWIAIKAVWDTVTGYFKMVWNNIKLIFKVVKQVLSGDFKGAWDSIKAIWNNVKGYFQGVWDSIKKVFSAVKSFFKTAFSSAWTAIKGVFKNVGTFFSGIWDTIKKTFTSIGTKVGDAIGGAFKTAINAVIATVEKAINLVPKAVNKVLDKINDLPGVEISKLPTVSLPRLAKGGVVRKATNAIIGEDGAEAVMPLERNTGWIDKLAEKIAAKSGAGVVVNQTNNYSQAHSRYEIYKSQQETAKAVKLAIAR